MTGSPPSPFAIATWLWLALTLAVLAAGPLLLGHPHGAAVATRRSP